MYAVPLVLKIESSSRATPPGPLLFCLVLHRDVSRVRPNIGTECPGALDICVPHLGPRRWRHRLAHRGCRLPALASRSIRATLVASRSAGKHSSVDWCLLPRLGLEPGTELIGVVGCQQGRNLLLGLCPGTQKKLERIPGLQASPERRRSGARAPERRPSAASPERMEEQETGVIAGHVHSCPSRRDAWRAVALWEHTAHAW